MEFVDAKTLSGKDLNVILKDRLGKGLDVTVKNSHSMHNIGTGMKEKGKIVVDGSTGFYTGGFLEGPSIEVLGDAGWYAGDNMMSGELIIRKNAGCNAGSYLYDGTIVIYGGTGNRPGYGMKGGTLLICGDAGGWAGQMTLGGRLIILGKVAAGLGESIYKGVIYVKDREAESKLGSNCFMDDLTGEEIASLNDLFGKYGVDQEAAELRAVRPMTTGRHNYVLFDPQLEPEKARKYNPFQG